MRSWREVVEKSPGATVLSAKWVVTSKETPQASVPKSSTCSTRVCEQRFGQRYSLLGHTRSDCSEKPDGSHVQVNKEEMKMMLLNVTASFLYGDCERSLYGVATEGSDVIKPELGCESDKILIRDVRRPAAVGEAYREEAEEPRLHRDEGTAGRALPQGERCGDQPPRGRLHSSG